MRYIFLSACAIVMIVFFNYCNPSKKNALNPASDIKAKVTYSKHMVSLLMTNCAPCHYPEKGGSKKPLDTYAGVSSQFEEILRRVELNPGDPGFMPAKRAKLSDTAINIIRQWKLNGLMQ